MKLSRAILDALHGATGAAMAMSVGCTSMREAPPPPPPLVSPVVMTPIRSAPVLMQPLPPLPRGEDVPADLAPLPVVAPSLAETSPPQEVSNQVLPPNHGDLPELIQSGDADPGPSDFPQGSVMPDFAATCGRG